MSMIKKIAPLQVAFKKLVQSTFNVVVRIQFISRIIESMMGLRPRQGNLRLVFRLFSLIRGLPSIRLK